MRGGERRILIAMRASSRRRVPVASTRAQGAVEAAGAMARVRFDGRGPHSSRGRLSAGVEADFARSSTASTLPVSRSSSISVSNAGRISLGSESVSNAGRISLGSEIGLCRTEWPAKVGRRIELMQGPTGGLEPIERNASSQDERWGARRLSPRWWVAGGAAVNIRPLGGNLSAPLARLIAKMRLVKFLPLFGG
jgi:hypothetical protein